MSETIVVRTPSTTVLSVTTPHTVVVTRGVPGPRGLPGDPGTAGPAGEPGLRVAGAVDTAAELPASAVAGQLWVTRADGRGHVWDGAQWVDIGPIALQGPPGKDGQIRYTGHGPPPPVIVGANPGDTYLDLDTGDVFKLQ